MRILFISNLYPPNDLGGWEQNCKEIAQHLQTRGHVCHVLTSCFGVHERQSPETDVTRVLYLEADIYHYRPLDFFLRCPGQERANQHALRVAIDTHRPDVVFIWGMWNLSRRVAYWAEQWMPGRVAYAIAGYWPMERNTHEAYWQQPSRRGWVSAFMRPARWLAIRALSQGRARYPLALTQVACVSEYVRRKLTEAGALPHGARVIYNGIEPEAFLKAAKQRQSSPDLLRLVYTGGLIADKGVHSAINALGLLRQRGLAGNLHLDVVGGGHPIYETELRERVKALGLSDQVTFRGRVPRHEIASILADHDVFLFTSVYEEPIARTVMEAMAAGLAVIGTSVGGQREMLEDGMNALIFPPDDAGRLAESILQLQRDAGLRSSLADAGRRTVLERFTLDRMVEEMEEWLVEVAG
jgi:glycosyltransferase involved in cell wall biosynthesis